MEFFQNFIIFIPDTDVIIMMGIIFIVIALGAALSSDDIGFLEMIFYQVWLVFIMTPAIFAGSLGIGLPISEALFFNEVGNFREPVIIFGLLTFATVIGSVVFSVALSAVLLKFKTPSKLGIDLNFNHENQGQIPLARQLN